MARYGCWFGCCRFLAARKAFSERPASLAKSRELTFTDVIWDLAAACSGPKFCRMFSFRRTEFKSDYDIASWQSHSRNPYVRSDEIQNSNGISLNNGIYVGFCPGRSPIGSRSGVSAPTPRIILRLARAPELRNAGGGSNQMNVRIELIVGSRESKPKHSRDR